MSERLRDFLKTRGLRSEIFERLKEDKIDEKVIIEMSDDELKEYIPTKGDRVSTKVFARKEQSESDVEKRKISLLKSLKAKMKSSRSVNTKHEDTSDTDDELSYPKTRVGGTTTVAKPNNMKKKAKDYKVQSSNINFKDKQSTIASKSDCALVVGFSIYDPTSPHGAKYRQVRAPMGGGIRHIRVSKNTTKSDLFDKIRPLFFPDGRNCHGSVDDFNLDIATDVHGSQYIHNNETVNDIILRLGLKHLRCYLLAKPQHDEDCSSSTSEELPDMISVVPKKWESKRISSMLPSSGSSNEHANSDIMIVSNEELVSSSEDQFFQISQEVIASKQSECFTFKLAREDGAMVVDEDPLIIAQNVSHIGTQPMLSTAQDGAIPVSDSDTQSTSDTLYGSCISDNYHKLAYDICSDYIEEDTLARLNDSVVQFGPYIEKSDLNDTQPLIMEIKVHRGNVCRDLIDFFSSEKNTKLIATTFEGKMLKTDGTAEVCEDNGGVLRDALTEFYESFYLQYTNGNSVAVPVLRHDMTKVQWSAVAEVIRMGYRQEGIFPIRLALPFMQQAFFGLPDDPLDAFMQLIPDVDRLLFEEAIQSISTVDEDELLDLMDRHEAKRRPTDDNIKTVLTEIAHKEIIQMPLFVSECWSPALKTLGMTQQKLQWIYLNLKPDTKRVLKMFQFPDPMNADKNSLSSSMKRLVREMDMHHLSLFLRFCTGSDLLVRDKITIAFNESNVRCPTAHTCGCVLELPRSYAGEPYVTFKSEFLTILNNRYWQMDIV